MIGARVALLLLCLLGADNVTLLGDEHQDVRDRAAAVIRETVGKTPDTHDQAYWAKVLQSITIGMPKSEVEKIIPTNGETQPSVGQGMGSVSEKRRLDNNWEATLYFDADGKIYSPPKLQKSVLSIWIPPAPDFTGKWVTYFVNGQKATEIEYKDGEYNGTYTTFLRKWSKNLRAALRKRFRSRSRSRLA